MSEGRQNSRLISQIHVPSNEHMRDLEELVCLWCSWSSKLQKKGQLSLKLRSTSGESAGKNGLIQPGSRKQKMFGRGREW